MNVVQQNYIPNRLISLDIMKTVAVFFMILSHVGIMYGSQQVIYSNLTRWLAFTAEGIGAPAFIFSMGIAIVLSNSKTPKQICWRALALFITGYLLNVLKFYPTINWLHTFPKELFIETHRVNNTHGLLEFLIIADILQFAALSYLVCSFLQRWLGKLHYLGIQLCLPFFLFAPILYQKHISPSNYFIQLIYGKNYQVYFPLFPWLGFALMGLSVGNWIKSSRERLESLMLRLSIAGLLLVLVGLAMIRQDETYYFGEDYYHRGIGGLTMYCGQLLLFLSLYHILSKVLVKWLMLFFVFCSRNVTRIYITQWILIYWCWYFIPYGSQPWSRLWLYFLLFVFLSFSLVALWEYLSKMLKSRKYRARDKV